MHGLEMDLMFCYNEFWICFHICSLSKSILLNRVNKIMFTAILIQFTSIKRPLLKSRGWPLNRDRIAFKSETHLFPVRYKEKESREGGLQ